MAGDVARGAHYDRRFEELAARGVDLHGEADFVDSYGPASVLDAGCGTGRVAIELHAAGGPLVIIFHSVKQSTERYADEGSRHGPAEPPGSDGFEEASAEAGGQRSSLLPRHRRA